MEKEKKSSIIAAAFLITGNSVGSGLLALPVCIGLAGIGPGIIVIFLGAAFMTATGLILASIVNERRDVDFDLPSIYETILGKGFKWLAVVANLVVLYGLLVAYLSCLTEIARSTLGINIPFLPLVIFLIITSVNFFALEIIKRSNAVMVIVLFVSFAVLVILTGEHVEFDNFSHLKWLSVPLALPVLVNAFNFHNVIPIICRLLEFDKRKTYSSILIGVFCSFILNLIWCIVVVGSLKYSDDSKCCIVYSYVHNLPATVPLGKMIETRLFDITASTFAIVAVITSYWTIGAALTSFIGDLRTFFGGKKHYFWDLILCFVPPLIITLICPEVFISMQELVGGVGIAILFGLLPSIIFLLKVKGINKLLPIIMILFFIFVLVLAVLHKTGLLKYSV